MFGYFKEIKNLFSQLGDSSQPRQGVNFPLVLAIALMLYAVVKLFMMIFI